MMFAKRIPAPWLLRVLTVKLWVQALAIQLVSVLLIASVLPTVTNSVFAFEIRSLGLPLESHWLWLISHLCLVSGMAAAANMPIWWRWIHVTFPLAVITMQWVALPTSVYMIGFVLTLALYWSVHNTRVPFYPSFPVTWRTILHVFEQYAGEQSLHVLEIGSGLGDVSLFLAKQRPQDHVHGIEIAPLPWVISWIRALLTGQRATFSLGDYRQRNFADVDVVFAYLSPAVMTQVWQKVSQEMPTGSLFISSEFPVPDVTAQCIIYPAPKASALYLYYLP